MKYRVIKLIIPTLVSAGMLLTAVENTSCFPKMSYICSKDVVKVLNRLQFNVEPDLIKAIQNEIDGDVDYFNNTKHLDFKQLYIENNAGRRTAIKNSAAFDPASDIKTLHDSFFDGGVDIAASTAITIQGIKNLNNNGNHSIIANNFMSASTIANDLQSNKSGNEDNLLYGIPFALKDLIATAGVQTTCGSQLFKDFDPGYNATVYQSLIDNKAILTAKANMDEFAMGGTGLFSSYGNVYNPIDNSRIVGGSSSGSADLVSSKTLPFTIGTDTSDSVRQPASYTGTVGYIGTHGIVPTFGVLPYSDTDDDVGVFANHVADAAIVAQNITDPTKIENNDFYSDLGTSTNIHFAVIKGIENYLYDDVKPAYNQAINSIKESSTGTTINYINCSDALMQSLSPIAACWDHNKAYHSFLNLDKFIYGSNFTPDKQKYLSKEYINKLAPQVKRRIAAGACMELPRYKWALLGKDRDFRRRWNTEWNKIVSKCDAVLLPGASSVAPTATNAATGDGPSTPADDFIMMANIAGDPSIDVPYTKATPYDAVTDDETKMPFGINLTCKPYSDQQMFDIALTLENLFSYPGN